MAQETETEFLQELVRQSQAEGGAADGLELRPRLGRAELRAETCRKLTVYFEKGVGDEGPAPWFLVVECVPQRWTDVDNAGLRADAGKINGTLEVGDEAIRLRSQVGFGETFRFPTHDREKTERSVRWALSAVRLLLRHLARGLRTDRLRGPGEAEDGWTAIWEYHLEQMLEDAWQEVEWPGNFDLIGRQVPCGELGSIDLLARDREDERLVVIELKRDKSDDEAFGQLARYMGWVREHRADAAAGVKGIILARRVTPQLEAAAGTNPDVALMRYAVRPVLRLHEDSGGAARGEAE
ncbi:MAG: endonuclease NucS domain-containing protein [bacterium]